MIVIRNHIIFCKKRLALPGWFNMPQNQLTKLERHYENNLLKIRQENILYPNLIRAEEKKNLFYQPQNVLLIEPYIS